MSLIKPMLAVVSLAALAACSTDHYLLADSPTSVRTAAADPFSDENTPVARAQPPAHNMFGALASANSTNPENRSQMQRSGLNSDPNNPDGLPGRPQRWNSL